MSDIYTSNSGSRVSVFTRHLSQKSPAAFRPTFEVNVISIGFLNISLQAHMNILQLLYTYYKQQHTKAIYLVVFYPLHISHFNLTRNTTNENE